MLSVQIEKNENHAHIELRGPLTLAVATELRPQLQQLIAEEVSDMVIDLSLVDLIDSSGDRAAHSNPELAFQDGRRLEGGRGVLRDGASFQSNASGPTF